MDSVFYRGYQQRYATMMARWWVARHGHISEEQLAGLRAGQASEAPGAHHTDGARQAASQPPNGGSGGGLIRIGKTTPLTIVTVAADEDAGQNAMPVPVPGEEREKNKKEDGDFTETSIEPAPTTSSSSSSRKRKKGQTQDVEVTLTSRGEMKYLHQGNETTTIWWLGIRPL